MAATESDIRLQIVALLPRLRRLACALCGNAQDGDDIVQAACEKALSRLDQFEPGTRLDSWMFRIVQTTFIDQTRSRRRRDATPLDETAEPVALDARVFERTEARSDLAVVRDEMARMPDEQRAVLALVAIDGLSYKEAAEALGTPIGTVMSRLARARKRLADALEAPTQKVTP